MANGIYKILEFPTQWTVVDKQKMVNHITKLRNE